jgi:hypothetical protein
LNCNRARNPCGSAIAWHSRREPPSHESFQPLRGCMMRRVFSSRSFLLKPSPLVRLFLTASPSRISTRWPRSSSCPATIWAKVDLPEHGSPVNHSVKPDSRFSSGVSSRWNLSNRARSTCGSCGSTLGPYSHLRNNRPRDHPNRHPLPACVLGSCSRNSD